MSYTDAISRVSQLQSQLSSMQGAFTPPATAAASGTSSGTGSATTSFASALAQSQAAASSGSMLTGQSTVLPASAGQLLTTGQQQFAARLSANTGMSPQVVSAWLLAEESGGAASSRQNAGNNDWLNIGYTDSGTYGSADPVWSNPIAAADATAGWLKGQNTIAGYGRASSGIQSILTTAGQSPAAQIAAIQHSGWASSGYPDLPSLLAQVGA